MGRARKVEQDFYYLRDQLNQEGKLYEDDKFADYYGLGADCHSCMWGRPTTLTPTPMFADSDSMLCAFRKGLMSSETFAIVLDILRGKEDLWSYVVAEDQSFVANYAGMFLFRFWRFDQVVPTIIDDVLPLDDVTKKPLLTTFIDNGSLWCTLMEKAYAKFLGGYERLKHVTLPEAMSDILGCSVHLYPLKNKGETTRLLKNMFHHNGVLIVSLSDNNFPLDKNLNTLFTVTSMNLEANEAGQTEWILTLRNPFTNIRQGLVPEGADLEDETDCSNEEREKSTDLITTWNETLQINLGTLLKVFDKLYVGLMKYPELSNSKQVMSNKWVPQLIVGRWGDLRQVNGTRYFNPFIKVAVSKPDACDEMRMCTLIISLLQYCDSTPEKSFCNEIGLAVLCLKDTEGYSGRIPSKLLSLSEPIAQTGNYEEREICLHLRLEPGEYLIIPQRKRNCNESTKKCQKYLITLFSLEPVSIMNTMSQKYGKEYLSPLELVIEVPRYVEVGDAIKITVKITEMPPMTRFTITMMLKFLRTSTKDPLESLIKARLEYIEICQGLLGKELCMVVRYHEYIKFPLMSEEFMVRCSAFVHELATEVRVHKVITTIMPKLKTTIDGKMYTRQQCLMTAYLQNSLPITIHSAKFNVLCSSKESVQSNSTHDIPPFSTVWIICLMRFIQPGCQLVQTIFTSTSFHRTVSAKVQVMSSVSPADLCPPSEKSLLLGETLPYFTKPNVGEVHISCCINHKTIIERLDRQRMKPSWIVKPKASVEETLNFEDVSSDEAGKMMCCRQTKDSTPEAQLPEEQIPIELRPTVHRTEDFNGTHLKEMARRLCSPDID